MEETFAYIKESYGDIRGYLVAIGFTDQHQRQLREALLVDPQSYSDTNGADNEEEIDQKRGYDKPKHQQQQKKGRRAIARSPKQPKGADDSVRAPLRHLDSAKSSTL
jgi:hypothetical protein